MRKLLGLVVQRLLKGNGCLDSLHELYPIYNFSITNHPHRVNTARSRRGDSSAAERRIFDMALALQDSYRLDMKRLGEHVDGLGVAQAVAGGAEAFDVACEGAGVAADIDDA